MRVDRPGSDDEPADLPRNEARPGDGFIQPGDSRIDNLLRLTGKMRIHDSDGPRDPYCYRIHERLPAPDGHGPTESPAQTLRRFRPGEAGLPELTPAEATRYLDETPRTARPWLTPSDRATGDSRWVTAAIDRGDGHFLQRHEGYVIGELARARVERLQDPANVDPVSRAEADDAYTGKRHWCAAESTYINDPDAFATAYARAVRHPAVRDALNRSYDTDFDPPRIAIPIAHLLGPTGHEYCGGHHLRPIDGSLAEARHNRAEWVKAQRYGRQTDSTEPVADKIESFEGGTMLCVVKPKVDQSGYTIGTMFPRPPQPEEQR